MSDQRFIRFAVDGVDLDAVAATTDATAGWSIRVDDGIATVGYRGPFPAPLDMLELIPGPSGLSWTREEVLAVLPVSPGPEP